MLNFTIQIADIVVSGSSAMRHESDDCFLSIYVMDAGFETIHAPVGSVLAALAIALSFDGDMIFSGNPELAQPENPALRWIP